MSRSGNSGEIIGRSALSKILDIIKSNTDDKQLKLVDDQSYTPIIENLKLADNTEAILSTYSSAAINSSGADYAEMFEWDDGNPNNEDRVGRFVTLNEDKISLYQPGDEFILGAVSASPSVIGDVYDDQWKDKYMRDVYDRVITEEVEIPEEYEMEEDPQNVNVLHKVITTEAHIEIRPKLNPNYDPNKKYIPRSQRPEWDCVGMMGKLIVEDDGTCIPNKYCYPCGDGIATYSDDNGFRVLKRLDSNHVMILLI